MIAFSSVETFCSKQCQLPTALLWTGPQAGMIFKPLGHHNSLVGLNNSEVTVWHGRSVHVTLQCALEYAKMTLNTDLELVSGKQMSRYHDSENCSFTAQSKRNGKILVKIGGGLKENRLSGCQPCSGPASATLISFRLAINAGNFIQCTIKTHFDFRWEHILSMRLLSKMSPCLQIAVPSIPWWRTWVLINYLNPKMPVKYIFY